MECRVSQLPSQPVLHDKMNILAGLGWKVTEGKAAKLSVAQCRGKSHVMEDALSTKPSVRRRTSTGADYITRRAPSPICCLRSNVLVSVSDFDYKKLAAQRQFPEAHLEQKTELHTAKVAEEENWWDFCPICNTRLINQKCKYICPGPKCNFFMSCSEFDL